MKTGSGIDTGRLARTILRDIRVEAAQEFDRNFTRQGFFSEGWARHRKGSPYEGGHILVKTGQLRRSIRSRSDERSVTFSSDLPYAAIHNKGGKIRVTRRMKKYFWARYYQTVGGFIRGKGGRLSTSKRQLRLTAEAEFWKGMALMKVGSYVTIPQRKFLGTAPELEAEVRRIIEEDVDGFVKELTDAAARELSDF